MFVLTSVVALAAAPSFYPGPGAQRIEVDPDGTVRGHARTGDVLVATDDLAAVAALPEVASVHRSRGRVARVVPAPGVDDIALSVKLHDLPGVAWAHPNLRIDIRPRSVPDDPYFADQWHLQNTGQLGFVPGVDIDAPEAWEITRGAGQIVAILDSGIDVDHPDIDVLDGHDYIDGDESSDPTDEAHGTACAGLAVGTGDNGVGMTGVAYEAQAYGIRLIGNSTLQDMYDAFVEAVDAGATVLSNSWGFQNDCGGVSAYGLITESFEYAETVGRGGLGAAVVFAAGNDNCDITLDEMLAVDTVITVAAVNGFDVREPYSSFGPWVDIAAPSGRMYTTDLVGGAGYNGYPDDDAYTDWFSGTSASTPVISGTLALMFAANDRLTAAQARQALCDTAVRVDLAGGAYDDVGWSPLYGCGRVDAGAAVRAVANQGPPAAPTPTTTEAPAEAAVFEWTAAEDPDGDALGYTLRWRYANRQDFTRVTTDRTFADLTGTFVAGDAVIYQVRAEDAWGEGEWSAEQAVSIPAPPPPVVEETGCAHTPPAGWLAAGLALVWARRRGRRA